MTTADPPDRDGEPDPTAPPASAPVPAGGGGPRSRRATEEEWTEWRRLRRQLRKLEQEKASSEERYALVKQILAYMEAVGISEGGYMEVD